MSAAYFDLLRSIPDRVMRDAVIFSQRRWVRARKVGVPLSTTVDNTPPDERSDLERRTLLEVTRAREGQLKRRSSDGRVNAMVAVLLHQRDVMSTFPGGPFQGFSTECDFASPPFGSGYACFGTVAVQSGHRVCAHSLEWASGHETDIQVVGLADGTRLSEDVVDEDAKSRDRLMGWERPGSYDLDFDPYPLRSLDPEGDDIDHDLGFLKDCTSKVDDPRRSIRASIAPALRPGTEQDR